MATNPYQTYATDSLISRNRTGRLLVLLLWFLITCGIPVYASYLTHHWFNQWLVGLFIGLIGQAFVVTSTLHMFIIKVSSFSGFITVDQLKTFFGKNEADDDRNAYVVYGPGWHVSYPWEARESGRNFSLEEASETFTLDVQTSEGNLTIKGSVRMRANLTNAIAYLSGVASVAGDITDLIKAFLIQRIAEISKTTPDHEGGILAVLGTVKAINADLQTNFKNGISEFEDRFGVDVGDVTISSLMPSDALQKTMTGLSEAKIIADGTAILLGYANNKAMREAVSRGELAESNIKEARDRFMAASDNIKMDLSTNEWKVNIDGLDKLDPEIAKAITSMLPIAAALQPKPRQKGK